MLYYGRRGSSLDCFPVSGLLVFALNIWWALERELVQWHCLLACQRVSLWSLKLIGYWFLLDNTQLLCASWQLLHQCFLYDCAYVQFVSVKL